MDMLHQVLQSINKFLKECNIEEVKCDNHHIPGLDVAKAVKSLFTDLSEIDIENDKEELDTAVTQITASNSELQERITAFMKYSQNKIDEQNVKEFCATSEPTQEWGCARTESIYKRRQLNATHIAVTKVLNPDGPQMKFTNSGDWIRPSTAAIKSKERNIPHPVEERLTNIESHLRVNTDQASDVYQRIKNLEDRLLAMEGSSPEYMLAKRMIPPAKPAAHKREFEDFSLQEIDNRMRQLKQSLLAKKRKVEADPT